MSDDDKKNENNDAGKQDPSKTDQAKSDAGKGDDKTDDIEGLKRHNKAVLTELTNKKSELAAAREELSALKAEKEAAAADELKKKGEYEKLYKSAEEKNSSMQERLIRAELKAQALKEGIIDTDAVNLIPIDKVKINDQMEVTGVADAVAAWKAQKPMYFGAAQSGSGEGSGASDQGKQDAGKGTGAAVTPPKKGDANAKLTEGIKPGTPESKSLLKDWANSRI